MSGGTELSDALTTALALRAKVKRLRSLRGAPEGGRLIVQPDPVAFAQQVLGFEPWDGQVHIARALTQLNRVAVRSGQKTGKSRALAWIGLWWAATRPNARAIMTSSSDDQVRTILWPEVRQLHAAAARRGYKLGDIHDSHRTGLKTLDGRWLYGFATDVADNMGGKSSSNLLFIVDEASGVPDAIWEAIKGNMAGGGKILCVANPLRPSGWFYDLFKERRGQWALQRLSSLEAADYQQRVCRVPGLASYEAIQEEWAGYESTAAYACRVLGEFPLQGEDSVISVAIVDAALSRWATAPEEGRLELGVDVARDGGDDSVVAPVIGNKALEMRVVHGYDSHQVAGLTMTVLRELRGRFKTEYPVRVKVDAIGAGAGVYDCLRREPRSEVEAVAVSVSESPTSQPTAGPGYALLRDQLWFAGREWLVGGGALPADRKLEAELAAVRFGYTASGKLKVESKIELKKRIRRSPDRADALLLAIYQPPRRVAGVWSAAESLFD